MLESVYGTMTILFPGILRPHARDMSFKGIFSMSIERLPSRIHVQTCFMASGNTAGWTLSTPVSSKPDVRSASARKVMDAPAAWPIWHGGSGRPNEFSIDEACEFDDVSVPRELRDRDQSLNDSIRSRNCKQS
jgi:hypothetical protein